MTCGLGLRILLICLIQAECVYSWAEGAQSFQNRNTYAGFPLPDGLRKFGSDPQDQLRRGLVSPRSVQSSSFNTEPAVNSGFGRGLSTRSYYIKTRPRPAHSSVRLVKSSLLSEASRQSLSPPRADAPDEPKQAFGRSIASGTSVSQRSEKLKDVSRRRSWPAQQATPRSGRYPSSRSTSAQKSRESYSFRPASRLSAAQKPSNSAASKRSSYRQMDSSIMLSGPAAPGPRGRAVRKQTSARGPARRVFSSRPSGGLKARGVSSRTEWGQPYVSGGSYRPRSLVQSYQPSSASQGVPDLAFPRSSRVEASAQGFAPATVYEIPNRFGGSPIRRQKEPADQNMATLQRLHISTNTPERMSARSPNPHRGRPESKWSRAKGQRLQILLIFLVQAEHVCCSWDEGAQRFQNRNTYAGFPLPDGLRKFGSDPQDQLRRGLVSPRSVQSSSFNTEPAVNSGLGRGLSTRSYYIKTRPRPAHSSVRLVKSSLLSEASRQSLSPPRADAPDEPKQAFGRSIASGTSVSQRSEKLKDVSRRRSWPAQQATPRSGRYPSSRSTSAQKSRESYSFRPASRLSAAQKPSNSAASKRSSYRQMDSSIMLSGPAAPGPRGRAVRKQTSARGPARRVFSSRPSGGLKARGVSSRTEWGQPYVSGGSYRPRSLVQSYQPSSASQGVPDLAFPRSSRVEASAQGFAPATVYEIPNRFGGSPIRRQKEPADQNMATLQRLHISTNAPERMSARSPNLHRGRPESKWSRAKVQRL